MNHTARLPANASPPLRRARHVSDVVPGALVVLIALVVSVVASPAHAEPEPLSACTLRASLPVLVSTHGGTIDATLDAGADVSVMSPAGSGRARVRVGETIGTVDARELTAACAGTLRVCHLEEAIEMYAQTRSDGANWRIKPGARIAVLRTGKVWAELVVGDLEGYAKADEVDARCPTQEAAADVEDDVEPVVRGEGPGIALLPLLAAPGVDAGSADAAEQMLALHLAHYRPDAARLPPDDKAPLTWKQLTDAATARGRRAGVAWALVGRLSPSSAEAGAALVLDLALLDLADGHLVRGIKTRPSRRADDPWAEAALATLLPLMPGAPGASLPHAPSSSMTPDGLPTAHEPSRDDAGAPAPTSGVPASPATRRTSTRSATNAWSNGWAWGLLGASATSGIAAGVSGVLAIRDRDAAARATFDALESRNALAQQALGEAIASDVLTTTAMLTGVLGATLLVAGFSHEADENAVIRSD